MRQANFKGVKTMMLYISTLVADDGEIHLCPQVVDQGQILSGGFRRILEPSGSITFGNPWNGDFQGFRKNLTSYEEDGLPSLRMSEVAWHQICNLFSAYH